MAEAPVFETSARAPITAAGAVLAAIVIAGLYFGRDILVPLALATLLVFVLTPPLQWLRRSGVPKIIAVILVTSVAALGIGSVLAVVGTQLVQLAEDLPGYQSNIKSKLADLRTGMPGTSLFSRVSKTIDEIGKDLRAPAAEAPSVPRPQSSSTTDEAEPKPIPVTITSTPMRPLEALQTYVDPILTPLATAALVVLFVIFILIEREELRDRFIALIGAGDVQRSTEAIMDAADRVSRYLLMQLIVNVTYGIAIGAGLWLIGVPNAILWGILAAVLRFIPYLGPWIAAIMPTLLAFATAPGWTMVLLAVGLFVVIELLSNNIMEPMLYGSTTGLSSFAIILAAIFWTLIWGPIGLLVATPLTVCLVVVGRYVPRLEFLDLLLSSTPVLSPPERLYQRLLTGNVAEALELTEETLDTISTSAFIEDVALPALRLAERDRERGANPALRRNVAEGVEALMAEVELGADAADAAPLRRPLNILCIGGRTELDQSAAAMLAAYFRGLGHRVEAKAPLAIQPSLINQLDPSGFDLVALCYLERRPERHARNICRRLTRQAPEVSLLVCGFNLDEGESAVADFEAQLAGMAAIATSMAGVDLALDAAGVGEIDGEAEARGEATLEEVLATARRLRLDAGTGEAFDRLTAGLAPLLEDSLVMVALTDWPEGEGAAQSAGKPPSQQAQIARIVRERTKEGETGALIIPSVATDKELASNELLLEKGICFFAAAPIVTDAGHYAGALCVLDADERALGPAQIERLEAVAQALGREISDTSETPRPNEAAQPRYRRATSS